MSFFKQNKNKSFSYTPRYYDERKERLEELKKQQEGVSTSAEVRMRGKFKRTSQHSVPGFFSKATLRSFVILGFLILAVYYFLSKYSFE